LDSCGPPKVGTPSKGAGPRDPREFCPDSITAPEEAPRVHRPASGPKIERAVGEKRAVGLSQKTIAAKLDISRQTVSQVLKREHVQVDIAALNQDIKEAMLARAERLILKAMGMAEDKVDQDDAKGFDQAMRGVHSVERIRSNVVNKPKKVEMAGSAPMQIDVRAILAKLAED
jgi:transcriptional regulator with XRE-family HTH domain